MNIIAAISSTGDAYYTINYGMTNTYTILHFFMKLMEQLDNTVKNWRDKVIIMVDNALYHKSKLMLGYY
jgi:hypothetical protein